MNVLITGGFGYLGGRLAQFLAQSGHKIILGSRTQTESPPWLPQAELVRTKWNSLVELEKICSSVDMVVHLAGMNAQDCAADPIAALEMNGLATGHLLRAAVRQGVKRIVYMSTAHVYGSPLAGVITEETCPVNLHPYATSHRAGEDAVRMAHQRGEIEGIVIRLSNAFGAPAHKGANCWMLLVNDLCRQAVKTQCMVLHSSGVQKRAFITLSDVCRAIGHLLELPSDNLDDGLFNVGGAWSPTVLEMSQYVAERVHAITDNKPNILHKEDHNIQEKKLLDYQVKKFLNTGFNLNMSRHFIEEEIDGLIKFCLTH